MLNIKEVLKKCNIDVKYYNEQKNTLNKSLDCSGFCSKDFEVLNQLEYINGDLILRDLYIDEFSYFTNLKSVNGLTIQNLKTIKVINGFNSLVSLNSLLIEKNIHLENIFGFNSLFLDNDIFKGTIKIINNSKLNHIYFLRGLKQINSSLYLHNNSLKSLEGLEELEYINASLSLSSNSLTTIKALKNLKHVDGMIGLVNNNLTTLDGLENLEYMKTIKWNNSLRTIAISGNDNLKDITALSKIVEITGNCIVIVDTTQEFINKPSLNSVFAHNNITVFTSDKQVQLLKTKVCHLSPNAKSRFIDIRDEFKLDDDWRPGLKYLDYVFLRGRESFGVQLERIDLVNWQDKIYVYHFLKQHDIPSMPIIMYSHRQKNNFFKKLKKMYENGLKSFVVKATHLANSNGVYRVKNGIFTGPNDTAKKDEMYGKDVDFDYLKKEIDKRWLQKQTEEDWSSMMVNPGVILEELIENSVELKFSIVFGEIAGFFARVKGFPSFDVNGNLLSKNKGVLPHWWKEGRALALKVANLVRADHIRIDVFYHNNQPIINEITWNGGERSEFTPIVSKKLNDGYSARLKMLDKKAIDIKNDDFIEKLVKESEYLSLSNKSVLGGNYSIIECKFIIVDVDTTNPKFYWMNTKKHKYHYMFYKNILNKPITMDDFDSISYINEGRKNIVGTLIYHEKPVVINGKKLSYAINFWPTDSIMFNNISKTFEMIKQRAKFVKDKLFLHVVSDLQQQTIIKQSNKFNKSDIVCVDSETLMENINFLPMNYGVSYGILRFATDTQNFSIKDIVVLNELPNHLSHVSGILTDLPQTPLSHINLLAKQNKIPNAYLKNGSLNKELLLLKDQYVKLEVTSSSYKVTKAMPQDVEKYFDNIRPTKELIPKVNLRVKTIKSFKNLENKNYNVYGTKSSNLGELHNIFDKENLPDGFGIPFYFYNEFMKYNNFYEEIKVLSNKYDENEDVDFRDNLLAQFRLKIRDAKTPNWMEDEFKKIISYYPDNTKLRFRSSTNNEDLEDFSGAGLYDSYSYKDFSLPISDTVKKVWASIWNYRAFEERRFYKIVHEKTMMGVCVHPRYKKEKANGVAVTKNIFNLRKKGFYINVQSDESLVTNPDQLSIPEEIVVTQAENKKDYVFQYIRYSNLTKNGKKVLNKKHLNQLVNSLDKLDKHFKEVYNIDVKQKFAMEIEFKITKNGIFNIKQARPWVEAT